MWCHIRLPTICTVDSEEISYAESLVWPPLKPFHFPNPVDANVLGQRRVHCSECTRLLHNVQNLLIKAKPGMNTTWNFSVLIHKGYNLRARPNDNILTDRMLPHLLVHQYKKDLLFAPPSLYPSLLSLSSAEKGLQFRDFVFIMMLTFVKDALIVQRISEAEQTTHAESDAQASMYPHPP